MDRAAIGGAVHPDYATIARLRLRRGRSTGRRRARAIDNA
jgi:hypothetical protein